MYKGTLWLDFSEGEDEEHYQTAIDRLIIRDDNVVFEFRGHDSEEGHYSGNCAVAKQGDNYKGIGEFKYPDGTICKAQVFFTLKKSKNKLFLSGEWADEKFINKPYDLEAELKETLE